VGIRFTRKRAAGAKLAGNKARISGGSLENGRIAGAVGLRRVGVFGRFTRKRAPDDVPFRDGPALFRVNLGIDSLENGRD
jgi:hypothetical protein